MNYSSLGIELYNKIKDMLPMWIVVIVSISVSIVFLVVTIRLIRQQIKLYNSITLVVLKNTKFHYWGFATILLFFVGYIIMQMASPNSNEMQLLKEQFGFAAWQTNTTLSFLLFLLITMCVFFVAMALAKAAVVDKGVYTGYKYLDWYHVHDYIIDEQKSVVVLSAASRTFSTLDGTTPPLKLKTSDIAKIKFILNKNKNKFSGFDK